MQVTEEPRNFTRGFACHAPHKPDTPDSPGGRRGRGESEGGRVTRPPSQLRPGHHSLHTHRSIEKYRNKNPAVVYHYYKIDIDIHVIFH